MPNRNYISGRNFEYRTKRFFEKMDYFVMRAYGSKGIFDLVCFPPFVKDGWFNAPLGIQCKKNGYVPPQEREKLNSVKNKWQMVILIAWSEQKRTCTKNCQKNHRHVRKGELMLATLDTTQIAKEALDINNLLKK